MLSRLLSTISSLPRRALETVYTTARNLLGYPQEGLQDEHRQRFQAVVNDIRPNHSRRNFRATLNELSLVHNEPIFTLSHESSSRAFGGETYVVRFDRDITGLQLSFPILERRIVQSLNRIIQSIGDNNSYFQAVIVGDNLNGTSTAMVPKHLFTGDLILGKIASILQSNETLDSNLVKIYIKMFNENKRVVPVLQAGSSSKSETSFKKKSLIPILTDEKSENSCLFQALGLGLVKANHSLFSEKFSWNSLTKSRHKQTNRVKLANLVSSSIEIPFQVISSVELPKFEQHFEVGIIVFAIGGQIMYPATKTHSTKYLHQIYLLYTDNHFDLITEPGAFFRKSGNHFFDSKNNEFFYGKAIQKVNRTLCVACKSHCDGMYASPKHKQATHNLLQEILPKEIINLVFESAYEEYVECSKCYNTFFSFDCLSKHAKVKNCQRNSFCKKCRRNYNADNNHECSMEYCTTCEVNYELEQEHTCKIRAIIRDPDFKLPEPLYIIYDYECIVSTQFHEPFLICATYAHSNQVFSFSGRSANDDFCQWLFQPKHNKHIAIAHNAKAYDSHFIRSWVFNSKSRPYNIHHTILNGLKCMSFEVSFTKPSFKLTFRDSSLMIPKPLRDFPKCFQFEDTQEKGYFPYTFVNWENLYSTLEKLPEMKHFGFDSLSTAEYSKAVSWYEAETGPFNILERAKTYCQGDVLILKKGILKFRDLFLELSDDFIDPFQHITLPQICMKLFRYKFYTDKCLALLPDSSKQNTSRMEQRWLQSHNMSRTSPSQLKMLKRQGIRLQPDGYDTETRTAYEFFGCYFHGCVECFPRELLSKKNAGLMETRYSKTLAKISLYSKLKINLVSIWEHNLSPEIRVSSAEELSIRASYFGGRTEPIVLNAENIQADYIDYTSLYPYVMNGKIHGITEDEFDDETILPYPIGIPKRIVSPALDYLQKHQDTVGFICCAILPPQDLYFPVLPCIIRDKLIFTLCLKCAQLNLQNCSHAAKERMLTGTWAIPEVRKAIEKGYQITRIFAIESFPDSIDQPNLATGVFQAYINTFITLKIQAEGYPSDCDTAEKGQVYINYHAKNGVMLEASKISKNPALREISKLCLNSLYGKFAQQNNRTMTKEFNQFQTNEYYALLKNPDIDEKRVVEINENNLMVSYTLRSEVMKDTSFTNIAIASYITAYARLRLYTALEIAGKSVLYVDTDSVIYCREQNSPEVIITGPRLGDFKNELKDEEYITSFQSTGPKSYSFKTNLGNSTTKVKGLRLSAGTSNLINHKAMKSVILDDKVIENVPQLKFTTGYNSSIKTSRDFFKKFQMTFDKRVILDTFGTIPFGYIE